MNTAINPGVGALPIADSSSRVAVLGLGLFALATWMLQHPYSGIYHDSAIYSLLALAHLHADLLSGDVFLRFGSQDQFTIFSPMFAATIKLLGLETAAALLTLASQFAFFVAAWFLARRFMSQTLALLAIGLLAALPAYYGSGRMFSYTEDFLTPRLMAEALVLGSLVAAQARRVAPACVCMLAALLLHPLMAAAGVVLLSIYFLALPRPRMAFALGVPLLLLTLCAPFVFPIGTFARFDATWLAFIEAYNGYLFISNWSAGDWSRLCIPMAVLLFGVVLRAPLPIRTMCACAMLTAITGLALTFVWCDWLHLVAFTRIQPWRWLWIADVAAIVLAPAIVADRWQSGPTTRSALVLLAGAWMFNDQHITPIIALLAITCAATARFAPNPRYGRLMFGGSCALLIIAMATNIGDKVTSALINEKVDESAVVSYVTWVRAWAADGVLPAAALTGLWWLFHSPAPPRAGAGITAAAALVCICLAPPAWSSWASPHYTNSLRAAFTGWREEIPERAEVLWPDTPVGAWYLLERQSYWSLHQIAGDIFSRGKAVEMGRRTASIKAALLASGINAGSTAQERNRWTPNSAAKLDARGLAAVCTDPALSYVVSWNRLGPSRLEPIAPDAGKPKNRLHLYRCADLRTP